MKLETCVYSGYKISPGHGKRMIRSDGKVQIFLSKKCMRSYKLKRNPRDVPWTVLYRRKHKKGTHGEDGSKTKRTRRTVQVVSRAIGNTSLEAILAKRNQKPEFRRQQREQAVKAAKEQLRSKNAEKRATKSKEKKSTQPKTKAPKPMKVAAPRVGGKR